MTEHVVLINRNYPPRSGPTGARAQELVRFLLDHAYCRVTVLTVHSRYGGVHADSECNSDVRSLPTFYNGKRKLPRLLASFFESLFLILWALSIRGSKTVVMTDPPFLAFFASLLFPRRKKWALWSMDLYPEAFTCSGLVSQNNLAYRILKRITYRRPPNHLIALGENQAAYVRKQYGSDVPVTVLPCGMQSQLDPQPLPDWYPTDGRIVLGYCGNLGEAHSVEFVETVIRLFDRTKFFFVLAAYGTKVADLNRRISAFRNEVRIVDEVQSLTHVDVHLVTLMPHWNHVCVPSKAVSAVCSGSTMLFGGSTDCDNWSMLQSAGWLVDWDTDPSELDRSVAEALQEINADSLARKKAAARAIRTSLNSQIGASMLDFATRFVKGHETATATDEPHIESNRSR